MNLNANKTQVTFFCVRNLFSYILLCIAIAGATTPSSADSPSTSISNFGDAKNLRITFDRSVEFITHSNGGITVKWVDGLQLQDISTSTKERGGAMWNPGQGKQGYASWAPQGFDANMVSKYKKPTYDANLTVAPAASGAPFPIPGEGSLIIALPRNTTDAIKMIDEFRVVNFADTLPEPGSYRAPTRGIAQPRENWTQARVHRNLDKYFPANREPLPGWDEARIAELKDKWQTTAAAGIFYTEFASDEISPERGLRWYGRDLCKSLGPVLIDLNFKGRDEAFRYALADAIVQYGIDIYGTMLDGAYFQMNGGWTHGRIWIVEIAGILLEDEYMLNMVADPLNKPIAPGVTISVLPFTEQRQFAPVRPKGEYYTRGTNPAVSDQMAQWGSVVGADNDEDLALTPEDVGIRYWMIQNDRSYGKRSHLNSWIDRAYHSVNMQGQAWVRPAYYMLEENGHSDAISGTKPIRDGIDTSLQQWWQMLQNKDTIREQGMIEHPDRFISHDVGNLYADWNEAPGQGLVDVNLLHQTKPGRAYAPILTDNGDGTVTVEFNAYMPGHGYPVTRHDVRWSIDAGETWTVILDATDQLIIQPQLSGEATVTVQTRITTEAGTGAWSPTMTVERGTRKKRTYHQFGEITVMPSRSQ